MLKDSSLNHLQHFFIANLFHFMVIQNLMSLAKAWYFNQSSYTVCSSISSVQLFEGLFQCRTFLCTDLLILNWASFHCNFTHSTLMLLIKRYENVVWLKSKPPILLQGGRSHCLPVMSWASSMSFQHICVNCSIISTNTNKAGIN